MTCGSYHPDLMAMGDCSKCGHTQQSHIEQNDKIEQIIMNLRGTAMGSLEAECEAVGLSADMEAVTTAVDEQIFCCTQCGWWCEIDEESSEEYDLDEWTCRDCCEGTT